MLRLCVHHWSPAEGKGDIKGELEVHNYNSNTDMTTCCLIYTCSMSKQYIMHRRFKTRQCNTQPVYRCHLFYFMQISRHNRLVNCNTWTPSVIIKLRGCKALGLYASCTKATIQQCMLGYDSWLKSLFFSILYCWYFYCIQFLSIYHVLPKTIKLVKIIIQKQ